MDKPAPGSVNATPHTVIEYLTHQYGGRLDLEQARALVKKHAAIVADAQKFSSFASYAGGKILKAEGLPEYDVELPDNWGEEDDDDLPEHDR